jgi:hypothetical protein
MYDHTQTTKEVAGAIFYAMLSLYDDAAERAYEESAAESDNKKD